MLTHNLKKKENKILNFYYKSLGKNVYRENVVKSCLNAKEMVLALKKSNNVLCNAKNNLICKLNGTVYHTVLKIQVIFIK